MKQKKHAKAQATPKAKGKGKSKSKKPTGKARLAARITSAALFLAQLVRTPPARMA